MLYIFVSFNYRQFEILIKGRRRVLHLREGQHQKPGPASRLSHFSRRTNFAYATLLPADGNHTLCNALPEFLFPHYHVTLYGKCQNRLIV